tara:strand:- start:189 stop:1358 length:1170 start_codon:yes stop_codon:yes gene_type:complete
MDDILKEAIADAKALRATALENAKIALEEAFTPRLKSMLSQKIQSEDLPDNEEYGEGEGEVGSGDGHMEAEGEHETEGPQERKHSGMQDADVEPEEGPEEAMYGADVDPDSLEKEDEGDMEDAGMHDDEMEPDSLEKEEEEGDMEDAGMHDDDAHEKDELDELDLESVIKELEEELDSSDIGDAENKEPSERANDSSEVGAQGPEGEGADEEGGKENSEDEVVKEPVTEAEHGDDKDELEEIDLEEVIKALEEETLEEEDDDKDAEKVEEMQTQLKEYKDTIGFLREKLNEVNLLNAKLLFTNKLFRGFGLNNNQKLSVVEQFDRTQNLREIKLVYATLAESFKGNGNKRVNENKGQASKAVASTEPKKEVLSEGMEMKNRFKKLANLI